MIFLPGIILQVRKYEQHPVIYHRQPARLRVAGKAFTRLAFKGGMGMLAIELYSVPRGCFGV
jgi:hypothetical protein